MTKPTVMRQELRQSICRELQERFFRKFPSGSITTSAGTTTTAIDTKLASTPNDTDFWVGDWYYAASGSSGNIGATREIVSWNSTGHTLTLEYALPAIIASSDGYEIHSIWTPEEVHRAIDRAIDAGSKAFFDTVTDETLIICEDKLAYDLTGLTIVPWIVTKVLIEQNSSARTGNVTSAAAGTLLDTDVDFSDLDSDWKVSIYSGTGAGQLRDVSTITGTTQINVTPNWTTTPDSTSSYTTWNPTEEKSPWYRIMAARFDSKEFPNKLYLSQDYSMMRGLRMRLEYATRPSALSADSDTTVVPKEYIINKACAYLYGTRIGDNRSDRQKNTAMEAYYTQKAELYLRENAFRMGDKTVWQEQDTFNYNTPSDNPLNW